MLGHAGRNLLRHYGVAAAGRRTRPAHTDLSHSPKRAPRQERMLVWAGLGRTYDADFLSSARALTTTSGRASGLTRPSLSVTRVTFACSAAMQQMTTATDFLVRFAASYSGLPRLMTRQPPWCSP